MIGIFKRFLFLVSILTTFVLLGFAEEDPNKRWQERLDVDLVDLYLTASTNKGEFVGDLKPGDLVVEEDGVKQSIVSLTNFSDDRRDIPLTLAILMDTSGSMSDDIGDVWKIDIARTAGLTLLQELQAQDQSMVISFGETPRFSALTADSASTQKVLQQLRLDFSYTALYDAMERVIEQLNHETGRKIVLLCSDGNDNISKARLDDVLRKLEGSPDITVLALGTVGRSATLKVSAGAIEHVQGRENLKKMAEESSGYAFFPTTLKEVEKVRALLQNFLRSQYSLAYRPTNRNMNGAWRKIKITSHRKDVRLKYRDGYYAK